MSTDRNSSSSTPVSVKLLIAGMSVLAMLCIASGMVPWRHTDLLQFVCYLILCALTAPLKMALPGSSVNLSLVVIICILGIGTMSLSEALALGLTATVVQCYWKASRQFTLLHFAFNISQISMAVTGAYWIHAWLVQGIFSNLTLLALLFTAAAYFLLNSFPVALVVLLSEKTTVLSNLRSYFWMLPFYLISAAFSYVIQVLNRYAGWEATLVLAPAVYAVYRVYGVHIGRMEDMKKHFQEMSDLHLRTVEALALAIDAKDHNTGEHVYRVQIYAMELAKDLNLSGDEKDALRAAAVLHDIGKLAVPEHIISKPGKLTHEEFEKMKVHPLVGAEILSEVKFPYPVVPIVRSHHERWDGSGYPDGLRGEEIPMGARILSAVDTLDALSSDRQYRQALPLDQAMACVEKEAGKMFDPRVVAALKSRYLELEQLARSQNIPKKPRLSTEIKVAAGTAPAAGYAEPETEKSSATRAAPVGLFDGILPEISAQEKLPSFTMRLRNEVAFDSLALFHLRDGTLVPYYVYGEDCGKVLMVRRQVGDGILGWVAQTGSAVRNSNPALDIDSPTLLLSAMAAPLMHGNRTVGVIALYHSRAEAFSSEDLNTLLQRAPEITQILPETAVSAEPDFSRFIPGATSTVPRASV